MNTQSLSLSGIQEGQTVKVSRLLTAGRMRRRLQEMGVIPGAQITCLQKSPAGDPIAYLIRGAVIALRSEDSSQVLVQCC